MLVLEHLHRCMESQKFNLDNKYHDYHYATSYIPSSRGPRFLDIVIAPILDLCNLYLSSGVPRSVMFYSATQKVLNTRAKSMRIKCACA